MHYLSIIVLMSGLLTLNSQIAVAQNEPEKTETLTAILEARIEPSSESNRIVIQPTILAQTKSIKEYGYALILEKTGPSGKINSRQQGRITLCCGEKKSLSLLQLSQQEGDHYQITLRIFNEQSIVAEQKLSIPAL